MMRKPSSERQMISQEHSECHYSVSSFAFVSLFLTCDSLSLQISPHLYPLHYVLELLPHTSALPVRLFVGVRTTSATSNDGGYCR